MVVVGRDELVEGHVALRVVFQQVDKLQCKLLCALNLLRGLVCNQQWTIPLHTAVGKAVPGSSAPLHMTYCTALTNLLEKVEVTSPRLRTVSYTHLTLPTKLSV